MRFALEALHAFMVTSDPPASASIAPRRRRKTVRDDRDHSGVTKPKVNAETVNSLLANVRELARDEQARGQSLKTRASWALGFQGVVLALVLTVVGDLAIDTKLGPCLSPIAGAFGLIAALVLLDSARWSMRALRVEQMWHVGPEETDKYPTYEYIGKKPEVAEGEMIKGWSRQFREERAINNDKADQLEKGLFRLNLSFVVLAALLATVALRTFGV